MLTLGLEKEKPPDYIPVKEYVAPILTQPKPFLCPQPSATITTQTDWMSPPYGTIDCPPGLEYLSTINQLLVHQKVEILETITGFESNNKFSVKNCLGEKVYLALEDSNWLNRLGGPMRPFEMKIINNFGQEVIHLHRPLACHGCMCPFWLQRMVVFAPLGVKIGSIEQEWGFIRPQYNVKNSSGETVLKIKGPACRFTLAVDFTVYSKDGRTVVGKITKHWSGLAREVFTDADYFGIAFPIDLDVRIKAVLLGACFLIDFMFFED